jgi:selenium-binding protein 1
MRYSVATLVSLLSLGESLGISLPPLIPSIPGVTEPLTTNAPPLPVLQVPTPPLESPPFTPSSIKPKKIGYFWTGSGDKFHKGAVSKYFSGVRIR